LAVGLSIDYVLVKEKASGKRFVLAQALLASSFKNVEADVEIEKTFKGSELLGVEYEPLFEFFQDKRREGAFRVIDSDHVTTDSGTGIVHMAPAFGEEDYLACKKAGIPVVNPVDDDGMFTSEVPPYQGKRVKDADKEIIHRLKGDGRLFKQDTIVHSYPYCWRSDTPLIYRAISSWFVSVEKIKEQIVANNKKTSWVPDHLRDGRFGNWLENARDWAISRNRFWGTPIPIWRNAEGEMICVGSREELEKLSGKKVSDLHMEFVDQLEIPSKTGKSPLKRIDPVLDCWFESGSMPFAQWGYPFENKAETESAFPADFIAEGLDQTRGWFYTLMVIGTALKGQAPFKNVVVNGLILAEDGKKMSKSLRNYPDPMEVLNKHGADALRLYMIDSPVVKAQELRFSETGVTEVTRRILLRWWNAYSFFVSYANIDGFKPKRDSQHSKNILDQWVLSRLHTLIENTEKEMGAYRLYNVVPQLLSFIEDLTNTYIRFNRSHFWQEGMPEDKRLAFETLYEVLFTLSKVMAPFAPFLAEVTYQNLSQVLDSKSSKESVHLETFPTSISSLKHAELEEAVRVMDALVLLGRNQREKIKIKAKIPLKSLKIIHREKRVLENLKKFQPYFQDELNVREVEYESNEDAYIQITAKANFPILGKRLGAKMKAVAAEIQKFTLPQILKLEKGESVDVQGEGILLSEVEIRRSILGVKPNLATHSLVSIELDPTVTEEQIKEGLAREVVRKIQAARKAADFNLDDRIELQIFCSDRIAQAISAHRSMIQAETLTEKFHPVSGLTAAASTAALGHREEAEVDGETITVSVKALPKK
jgi:isoleucyl-tRNA synthetase